MIFFIGPLYLCDYQRILLFSLKHPAKYIGRKPRKYTIPAKPLGPIQQTPEGGGGPGEQVRMYREPSSGALHPSQYIRVRPIAPSHHAGGFFGSKLSLKNMLSHRLRKIKSKSIFITITNLNQNKFDKICFREHCLWKTAPSLFIRFFGLSRC
jgi:hypothetical protein